MLKRDGVGLLGAGVALGGADEAAHASSAMRVDELVRNEGAHHLVVTGESG